MSEELMESSENQTEEAQESASTGETEKRRRGRPKASAKTSDAEREGRWQVKIRFSSHQEVVVGYYDSPTEAAKAYEKAMSNAKAVIEEL
jgi:hypothetical protein